MSRSVKRMDQIGSDIAMREAIIKNLKKYGFREGGPCPCPDCNCILHYKNIEYTNTDKEPWELVKIQVLACGCGFQIRQKEEV